MTNDTILIGIDLGTTNSSVAINRSGEIELVKKPGGLEYTPSVFGFDKAKNKVVGQKAYELLFADANNLDSQNFKPEVKRIIGTPEKVFFERAGIEMNPEEISGEILKSLVQDVLRKYPEFETDAAVITIPAAFSVLQCEATKRAGSIAGFKHVVLLQEPIAAAISYGFGKTKNENWLVYDLGGGTFDVALVSSLEGVLTVLAHSGDNFLGGKNFDWEIVDRLIAPKLSAKFALQHFARDNKAYQSKFLRLKFLAERAKIELSQFETTILEIDNLGNDNNGSLISLSIELSRRDVEATISPLVNRTIDLCKEVLKESGIQREAVSKIILVGGPTQIPYISRRLEEDLKIRVDSSVDPLTVVARGACIYAMGQKIPKNIAKQAPKVKLHGECAVSLNYESLTAENIQTISGVVSDLPDAADSYHLTIQADVGGFTRQNIPLAKGKFFTNVELQPNKQNVFWLYLFNSKNKEVPIQPDSFSITHGLSVAGAPLPHSIGVAVVKTAGSSNRGMTEVFERLIEKGAILPARRTEKFKTVRGLKKGLVDNPLWIRVGEGESPIPDRNTYVCELGIRGSDLPKDLPEGTEIQLTVEINAIRELLVTAYIPSIDLALDARSTFVDELVDISEVEVELDTQIERARKITENCSVTQAQKIDHSVRVALSSVQNARLDEDEKRKAVKQLRDLKVALDSAQGESELPELQRDFQQSVAEVREIISQLPDASERQAFLDQLKSIESEGAMASRSGDKPLLLSVIERLRDFGSRALFANPNTWIQQFRYLTDGSHSFVNANEANHFAAKGKKAIEADDIEELKRCCRGLYNLLPIETQTKGAPTGSGIMR
jgi:molecular chaperone DnaK